LPSPQHFGGDAKGVGHTVDLNTSRFKHPAATEQEKALGAAGWITFLELRSAARA